MIFMPEIVYLIGPAASGKSTYQDKLIQNNPDKNYYIISSDKLIDEFAEEHGLDYWGAINRMNADDTIYKLVALIKKGVSQKRNIIIDRTNLTFEHRYLTMRFVNDSYTRIGVIFSISKDTLKYRLKRREVLTGKHVPDFIVDRMHDSFQFPNGREFHKLEFYHS